MLNLEQMQEIAKTENVIFYKPNCPFCKASEYLFEEIHKLGIVEDFSVYMLGEDFDNQTLTSLVTSFGWEPDGYQEVCTKPQVFVSGEYVGGNREFYESKWNLGLDNSGKILVDGEEYHTPSIKNPMNF
jgi:glutaredoxin